MRVHFIIIFGSVLSKCLSDSDFRKSKFVNVFTNHQNEQDVEDTFYQIHHIPNKPQFITNRKDTLNFRFLNSEDDFLESEYGKFQEPEPQKYFESVQESSDSNRNNYLYPNSAHFYTQTYHESEDKKKDPDKKYVFLQSQQVVPDLENYGSFYMTPENTNISEDQVAMESGNVEIVTIPYSYIQKIPTSPSSKEIVSSQDSNRYEEVNLIPGNIQLVEQNKPKDTKKQINNMIKKYLAKLIVDKYGLNKQKNITNKINRKYENNILSSNLTKNNLKTDPESKFGYTNALWDLKNKTISKLKQLFSIFTVVKFTNTECNATNWAGAWQGVCLASAECTQWNGTALGTCASGYGVCCVFRGTCGDSSSMNCSYFKSPNYPDYYPSNGGVITPTTTGAPTPLPPTPDPRIYWYYYDKHSGDEGLDNLIMGRQSSSDTTSCTFRVFKTNSNVRQFRIDFIDLDLASPTNGTCTTERLIITGQNTNDRIPVICGYNTGQHVYVDVSQLSGPLQLMILSTTGARKRFKLRICQYTDTCSSSQSNCLQYYTGVSGVIQSFNYDQAAMFNRSTPGYFNNLNYAICIRREAGYCSITYTNVRNGQTNPFQLVNVLPNGQSTVPFGQAGVDVLNCPDDYIIIDGTRLCGYRFNDGSTNANFSLNAPVTDTSTGPIVINVRTNSNVTGLGFKLYYMQNACT